MEQGDRKEWRLRDLVHEKRVEFGATAEETPTSHGLAGRREGTWGESTVGSPE